MTWNTNDPLVGERVMIFTMFGDGEPATVLAVSDRTANIKVRDQFGDVMIGNQWEPLN